MSDQGQPPQPYYQHTNYSGQPQQPQSQPTPGYTKPQPQPQQPQYQPTPQPQQPQYQLTPLYSNQPLHQAQPQPPPPPTFHQGWGFGQPDHHTSTPQALPRAVIGEPNPKKRALELEGDEDSFGEKAAQAGTSAARGRGRGRGGRGGHLWGWIRFGYYKSKPSIPSCLAHKRPECSTCYEWVWN